MSVQADIVDFIPGERVPAVIVADDDGDLPDKGDRLKPVGEEEGLVQFSLTESQGETGAAKFAGFEPDVDDDASNYAAGDRVGKGSILFTGYVTRETPTGGYAASVGDLVQLEDKGAIGAYTGAATQDPAGPFGMVLATNAWEFGQGDAVAVANFR